nr:hypothetical protein [Escherichia coli]
MGSCAAPSAKGDDKFITTDYLQQCPMVRLPPVVMSAKSATARTTIAREDAEDHQVKLSAQKLEELLASMVKDEVDRNDGIY